MKAAERWTLDTTEAPGDPGQMKGEYMNAKDERGREQRLRRQAKRQGIVLRKSRVRVHQTADDLGEYMLLDARFNSCLAGSRFDMTLDDVEKYLSEGERV